MHTPSIKEIWEVESRARHIWESKPNLGSKGEKVKIISIDKKDYSENIRDNFDRQPYEKLLNLEIVLLLQDELNHPSLFHLNEKLQGKIKYSILSIVHHLPYKGSTNRDVREAYKFLRKII